MPEIGCDQRVFAIALSKVYHRQPGPFESENRKLKDKFFYPSSLLCREDMSSERDASEIVVRNEVPVPGLKQGSSSSTPLVKQSVPTLRLPILS